MMNRFSRTLRLTRSRKLWKKNLLIISPINHLIETKLKDNYWKLAKKEEVVWYYQYNMETSCYSHQLELLALKNVIRLYNSLQDNALKGPLWLAGPLGLCFKNWVEEAPTGFEFFIKKLQFCRGGQFFENLVF